MAKARIGFSAGRREKCTSEKPARHVADMLLAGKPLRKFREFGIGQERRIFLRQMHLEEAVEILPLQLKIAGIVKILDPLSGNIEPVDGNRRLAMLAAIGRALRVGHVKRIHLDQAETAARDLRFDVTLDAVEDRKFADANAVERFEVFERYLEEGELIPFEILRQRKAQHRFGRQPERVQDFDPEIDIAVGFRPHALAGMQRMLAVAIGTDGREDGCHRTAQPQSTLRTLAGHSFTSRP